MGTLSMVVICACLAACAAASPAGSDPGIVHIVGVSGAEGFSRVCPTVGNLRFQTGLTLPQSVEKAFDEALASKGLRAPPSRLTGRLTRTDFIPRGPAVTAAWDIALLLQAPDGRTFGADLHHEFQPGMGGVAACRDAGDALETAVRLLVDKVVADPRFVALLQTR